MLYSVVVTKHISNSMFDVHINAGIVLHSPQGGRPLDALSFYSKW